MADARYAPPTPNLSKGHRIILQIQADGKAIPTVKKDELTKRKEQASRTRAELDVAENRCKCKAVMGDKKGCCKRHRNKEKRGANPKTKRKRGDKSKNGKSATIVVISLLVEGEDGKLHGPVAKRVWASLGPRKQMMDWAAKEVIRRGFDPKGENIQVLFDGELCLEQELTKRFPNAEFTLDVRHAEEYLWRAGRQFHKEGSEELACWIKKHLTLLHEGKTTELIRRIRISLTNRKKRSQRGLDQQKHKIVNQTLTYLEKRKAFTNYTRLKKNHLDIGTGQVEGAARNFVGQRLDEGGMRWSEEGGQAILQLRCIELNEEWETFQGYVKEEFEKAWEKSGPQVLLTSKGAELCP